MQIVCKMTMEPVWRETLLQAVQRDFETRERLARDGSLFDGYHREMEAVHVANAALLDEAFRTIGWTGRHRVGDDGAAAAFVILQHAISRPDVQRLGLALMLEAIPLGDASMIDAAYLSDRIAVFEGRPQLYGTQFDWFDGALSPSPSISRTRWRNAAPRWGCRRLRTSSRRNENRRLRKDTARRPISTSARPASMPGPAAWDGARREFPPRPIRA